MNILIVGEFSAFAKHLKNGFKKLGHKVTIVHSGDMYKKIAGDNDDVLFKTKNFIIGGHHIPGSDRILAPWTNRIIQKNIEERLLGKHVDLIIVVHYGFLTSGFLYPGVKVSYLKQLMADGSKLIMSACGNDPALWFTYPELCKNIGLKAAPDNSCFSFLIKNADAIIPTAYTYYHAIGNYCKSKGYDASRLHHTIPLPITMDERCNITSCMDRKIVIFHGVTRPSVKGTPIIKEAMDRLQKDYPDLVECRCEGGLPYDEYVKLFERIDILIDQTYFNGWGVNAAIGAMKGKCVLAPCGPECYEDTGIPDLPFIQIKPDAQQIFGVLKELVENTDEIDAKKVASRRFVEHYCESSVVAQRYLETVFNPDNN